MAKFEPNWIPDDDVDWSIPHPSPDEIGLWSVDDPGFIEELDRRAADDEPGIPWTMIRDELF